MRPHNTCLIVSTRSAHFELKGAYRQTWDVPSRAEALKYYIRRRLEYNISDEKDGQSPIVLVAREIERLV